MTDLNYLYRADEWQLIWFHDSFDILSDVMSVINRKTYVIFSFSWFASPERTKKIFLKHSGVISALGNTIITHEQILYLFNSKAEFESATSLNIYGYSLALVNNACFTDTQNFSYIENAERPLLAVYNAKPLAFKRHFLTTLIKPKLFITYDVNEVDYGITAKIDISNFSADLIVKNIPPSEVCLHLNTCSVGLILSEEEGACYASLEYLLCGLPVVSTVSRGGRDEYYNNDNSIVVSQPSDTTIDEAARELNARIKSGILHRRKIRESAIATIEAFRIDFVAAVALLLKDKGLDADVFISSLPDKIRQNAKLANFRNFFRTSI